MQADRRRALAYLQSGLVLCATACFAPHPSLAARPRRQPVALLVPLTGASATIGISMRRAATLAQPAAARNDELIVLDTQGTAAGAAAAAAQALRRGARMILGPLFAAEVRPVLAAVAGRIPVLSFSNDATLLESGAFLLGITAPQLTDAVLRYARRRGVRSVALLGSDSAWSRQSLDTALRLQNELGLAARPIDPAAAATPAALLATLRQANGGNLPDALLLPEGGAPFIAAANALRGNDVQLLGTLQALDYAPGSLAALDGAWLAAPDPAGFADFARTYEARNGTAPGAIAALAYDAAGIVNRMRAAGVIDRDALLVAAGFPGVAGAVRFRADGSCTRDLAILVANPAGYAVAERSAAA